MSVAVDSAQVNIEVHTTPSAPLNIQYNGKKLLIKKSGKYAIRNPK